MKTRESCLENSTMLKKIGLFVSIRSIHMDLQRFSRHIDTIFKLYRPFKLQNIHGDIVQSDIKVSYEKKVLWCLDIFIIKGFKKSRCFEIKFLCRIYDPFNNRPLFQIDFNWISVRSPSPSHCAIIYFKFYQIKF